MADNQAWLRALALLAMASALGTGCSADSTPPRPSSTVGAASSPRAVVKPVPTPAASPAVLQFPGHLPGARALSTYAGSTARSAVWKSSVSTDHWLLRTACTSTRSGTKLRYQVSRAQPGPVEEEEQLSVGSGEVACDGLAHHFDLGRIAGGPLAVDMDVTRQTLRAYAIVVPGPA
ncbi:MAG TPA: hypothetical protein VEQ66_08455 [Propionibacteriaceae bacterium]|nr:hypothetical protein [Propionibacteriaceae bacterium]